MFNQTAKALTKKYATGEDSSTSSTSSEASTEKSTPPENAKETGAADSGSTSAKGSAAKASARPQLKLKSFSLKAAAKDKAAVSKPSADPGAPAKQPQSKKEPHAKLLSLKKKLGAASLNANRCEPASSAIDSGESNEPKESPQGSISPLLEPEAVAPSPTVPLNKNQPTPLKKKRAVDDSASASRMKQQSLPGFSDLDSPAKEKARAPSDLSSSRSKEDLSLASVETPSKKKLKAVGGSSASRGKLEGVPKSSPSEAPAQKKAKVPSRDPQEAASELSKPGSSSKKGALAEQTPSEVRGSKKAGTSAKKSGKKPLSTSADADAPSLETAHADSTIELDLSLKTNGLVAKLTLSQTQDKPSKLLSDLPKGAVEQANSPLLQASLSSTPSDQTPKANTPSIKKKSRSTPSNSSYFPAAPDQATPALSPKGADDKPSFNSTTPPAESHVSGQEKLSDTKETAATRANRKRGWLPPPLEESIPTGSATSGVAQRRPTFSLKKLKKNLL